MSWYIHLIQYDIAVTWIVLACGVKGVVCINSKQPFLVLWVCNHFVVEFIVMKSTLGLFVTARGGTPAKPLDNSLGMGRRCSVLQCWGVCHKSCSNILFLVQEEAWKASGSNQYATCIGQSVYCYLPFFSFFSFFYPIQVDLSQLESNGFHLSVFRVYAVSCLTSWLTFYCAFCSAAAHNSLL